MVFSYAMYEQDILDFIKKEGPVLPIKISKQFRIDSFMASALLSELVSKGLIKSTSGNIGSSRLFYAENQEIKARSMIFEKLDDLGKMFVRMMNEHKVALESELGAQEKFLANKLRDFVVPYSADINGKQETVWAFSSLSKDEALNEISRRFKKPEPEKPAEEIKPVRQEQKTLAEQPKKADSDFENKAMNYFASKNIPVFEKQMQKKNKEFQFFIKVPSAFGEQECYVKAKSKKTIKEEDLSLAWLEAQKHKKQLIFVTDGKLSPKVRTFAETKFGSLAKIVTL